MQAVPSTSVKHHFFFWGNLAKAVIYLLVGGLAVASVIGQAVGPGGPQQVMKFIREQPFGQVILVVLIVGMVAYFLWRWYKALTDEADDGSGVSGLLRRTGYAISGTLYALLAVYAITLLTAGDTDGGQQETVTTLMFLPFGRVVVGLLAIAAAIASFFMAKIALSTEFMNNLHTSKMNDKEQQLYRNFGRLGYGARMVVYAIISYFLVRAALYQNPSEFRGMGGVLTWLSEGFGIYIMALLGVGLLTYGVFLVAKAIYKTV